MTMPRRWITKASLCWVVGFCAAPLRAQIIPWDLLSDPLSSSVCDVINAVSSDASGTIFRTELVVLSDTGELVLVRGADTFVPDTFADLNFDVFHAGLPFGRLSFEDDGDGFRTLWWTTVTGTVIHVDSLTGEPDVSSVFPSDFFDVPCDACPFWDDQSVCVDAGGGDIIDGGTVISPPLSFSFCGAGMTLFMTVSATSLGLTRLRRRRW